MSLVAEPQIPGRGTTAPPSLEDIRLDALSHREWRVIDTRLPEHDAPCVLGFIERCGNRYETLVLGRGVRRYSFPSLAEAKRHFAR
ncbi:hypothetical protein [Paramicrobacterium agarici]|uniref:Uncharacterized protein n=1 Tax=Paramicrobacterium agarici TaxID=630514 RepID=A0A2A9DZZ5_9MICO|nr:hypothetical protein [Microbacterium agarici]PFG31956.1 hypothetical protein ATJ78_2939 [Microbacterium agarici]TQO21847.1 hypothetical protein FB385_0659 [Microbacterium agarici]